jgi:hypothetical protein
VTPLAFAEKVAEDLSALPLPAAFHGQLGDIVVPCAGTYVTVTGLVDIDPTGAGIGALSTGNCGTITMADLQIIAARDCANVALDDGATNWTVMDGVSASLDADGDTLWNWADSERDLAWYKTPGGPSISYVIEGALSRVTLTVQLPLP